MSGFAILVIDNDGEESFVCDGMGDTPSRYLSKAKAKEFADFMKIGMEGECQSINVVPYPRKSGVRKGSA